MKHNIYTNIIDILMWSAIILIALSGFSIKINNFNFQWLGLLETIIRMFK